MLNGRIYDSLNMRFGEQSMFIQDISIPAASQRKGRRFDTDAGKRNNRVINTYGILGIIYKREVIESRGNDKSARKLKVIFKLNDIRTNPNDIQVIEYGDIFLFDGVEWESQDIIQSPDESLIQLSLISSKRT